MIGQNEIVVDRLGNADKADRTFDLRRIAGKPERERTPKVYIVEKMQKRITVADTDEGKELAGRIEDLKELLKAYRSGLLKERVR